MQIRSLVIAVSLLALAGCADMSARSGPRALMVVDSDEKQNWNDAGQVVLGPMGRDTVSIIDIGTDPLAPRILVNLPLANTIAGPPVNLAITPAEGLALVANSLNPGVTYTSATSSPRTSPSCGS